VFDAGAVVGGIGDAGGTDLADLVPSVQANKMRIEAIQKILLKIFIILSPHWRLNFLKKDYDKIMTRNY
jgi:hypothetical protein